MKTIAQPLLGLPRIAKRLIVLAVDVALCVVAVWFAFFLRIGEWVPFSGHEEWRPLVAVFFSVLLAVPIFIMNGFYRMIFRYAGWPAFLTLLKASIIYAVLYFAIITVYGFEGVPRTLGLIQPIVLMLLVGASRAAVTYWFGRAYKDQLKTAALPRVIIYGAGRAGQQMAQALSTSKEMRVVGFLDDDPALHRQIVDGIKIHAPSKLPRLLDAYDVSSILLAMPSISRHRRNEILQSLAPYHVAVRTLPSMGDLAHGKLSVSDIRELDIDDLLGREPVQPNLQLLRKNNWGKTVLVTGAGGSIGSELCRQILELSPTQLLLVELNEYALYALQQELEPRAAELGVVLTPLLGSVQNSARLAHIFNAWKPHTVYHAAAYKHVPLVEHNPAEGLQNNVLGTLRTAQAAAQSGVQDFVLVSTDKAVRPTNIMGASKRLAEMVLQALAAEFPATRMSMVRFGNVLGSSGSVVPKFRQQIRDGGPITLTHPDITRYFMTIPEAAQLVIQAGAMAQGADVFVLDMGEPVRIKDLAIRMVELSGLTVKTDDEPEGDIDIAITGLRPGEKLFEELLIGNNPEPTAHPRIMKAHETHLPWAELQPMVKALEAAIAANHVSAQIDLLLKLVSGYSANTHIVDWVHAQQSTIHG